MSLEADWKLLAVGNAGDTLTVEGPDFDIVMACTPGLRQNSGGTKRNGAKLSVSCHLQQAGCQWHCRDALRPAAMLVARPPSPSRAVARRHKAMPGAMLQLRNSRRMRVPGPPLPPLLPVAAQPHKA